MTLVLHVIGSIDRERGGTSVVITGLIDALVQQKISVGLISQTREGWHSMLPNRIENLCIKKVFKCNNALQEFFCLKILFFLFFYVYKNNKNIVLHSHGAWEASSVWCAIIRICFPNRVKLVNHPHGMLDRGAMSVSSSKKKIALLFYQRWALRKCDAFIVTSESEEVGLKFLLKKYKSFTIPHGIESNIVSYNPNFDSAYRSYNNPNIEFLFLSRLHHKKGLDFLVEAWARLRPKNAILTIVGDGSANYVEYLRTAIQLHKLQDHIVLAGPAYNSDKWAFYARAHYFVLPSRSENFALVVPEALSCGLPVITTSATPWSFLNGAGAGWCVSPDTPGIEQGLAAALSTSEEKWNTMSKKAKHVASRYSWNAAATNLCRVYDQITGISHK